ncbi:cycloartenol synthase 2-like [Hibiscus syriacus]|uniref:Cycloartenol synthase 2-like n=1 Tax=Hibiscus syriacus TaxID=106335 RepID=A0A6A3ATE9_HIBSY|nr:cycloartenol synthase 2-like [Hibiscus syriacus]
MLLSDRLIGMLLKQSLSEPVESVLVLDAAGRDTWASIRKLLTRETENSVSEFSTAISSFELDQPTMDRMLQGSQLSSVMTTIQCQEFGPEKKTLRPLPRMLSLRLLAVMAVIRLDGKPDKIENVLFSSLMEGTVTSPDPFASSTWEDVPPENTLITPVQCKSLWRQFKAETEFTVTQAISAQEAYKRSNSWLPPAWAIAGMLFVPFFELVLFLGNARLKDVKLLVVSSSWGYKPIPRRLLPCHVGNDGCPRAVSTWHACRANLYFIEVSSYCDESSKMSCRRGSRSSNSRVPRATVISSFSEFQESKSAKCNKLNSRVNCFIQRLCV